MTSQFVSSNPGRSFLPAWNRTGLCRKSGTDVRKLTRDRLSPMIDLESADQVHCTPGNLMKGRVIQLEKNIVFLKQQHRDTLEQLHKEIEQLKMVNRELNFKLVMCRCGGQVTATPLPKEAMVGQELVQPTTPSDEQLQSLCMQEDLRRLKNSLATERNKNNRLLRFMEKKVMERQRSSRLDTDDGESILSEGMRHSYRLGGVDAMHPRPPTLEECEEVIQDLQSKNSKQAHELLQIKADLRDVLYSHKWTPDAFLMARAYVSEDDQGSSTNSQGILPQVVPVTNRQTLAKAYQRVKEEVTLPALKPKVSCMVAERHRRAQAIRGRTSKGLL